MQLQPGRPAIDFGASSPLWPVAVQGVNTPEKAAGEGSLEKGLKNVGSKFIAVEQLVAQSAETVKERNGILPPEITKGVSSWLGSGALVQVQKQNPKVVKGAMCIVCGGEGSIKLNGTCALRLQDAQREMDDAEQYLAKVEKQYANKRL